MPKIKLNTVYYNDASKSDYVPYTLDGQIEMSERSNIPLMSFDKRPVSMVVE